MVAHLHPRSRSTLSLFTACLTVSFLVVGAPHILPCPVDRRNLSDSAPIDPATGEPRRRRRRKSTTPDQETEGVSSVGQNITAEDFEGLEGKRECPVPKPRGLIGQVMGFGRGEEEKRPSTTVVVQSLRDKRQEGS